MAKAQMRVDRQTRKGERRMQTWWLPGSLPGNEKTSKGSNYQLDITMDDENNREYM